MKIDFEDIYDRFFKDVYRFVLTMSGNPAMAEEVTQETFFKALKEIDHFKGNCSVKSWLCQIAKNLYIDDVRRRKRMESLKKGLAGASRAEEGNAEQAVIQRDEVHLVIAFLGTPAWIIIAFGVLRVPCESKA